MSEAQARANELVKHSTIYAIGNIARQLVGFIMLPVYTRYLTPADYGVVGLLTFAMSMLEPLFSARLGEAMPKYYFDEINRQSHRERVVVSTALAITAVVSLATSLVVFALQAPAATLLFGAPDYALAVGIFGFQILTQAIEGYGLIYIRIEQRPYLFLAVSLSKLCLQLLLNIGLVVFLELGVMGVIYSAAISSTAYALLLGGYLIAKNGIGFDLSTAKRMVLFSVPLWLAGLASLYVLSGSRYFIRHFGSLSEVGIFELANKFSMILPLLIWVPFSQYWETERFKRYHLPDPVPSFQGAFSLVTTLLITAGLGVSIFSSPVIKLISAESFHSATASVPLLTLAALLNCLIMFCNFSFMATEQTRLIGQNMYITAIAVTVFNLLAIPAAGAVGAGAALAAALAVQLLIVIRRSRRQFDMQLQFRNVAVLLALATGAYLLANHVLDQGAIVHDLIVKCLVFAAFLAFAGGHLLRKQQTRSDLLSFLALLSARLGLQRRNKT